MSSAGMLSVSSSIARRPAEATTSMHTASGASMRKSAGKTAKFGEIDHQKWCSFLRGLHPQRTAACVAADLGAPVRTVENWLAGNARPNLFWFARALSAYGPEMLEASMIDPPGWLVEARRRAQRAQLERQLAELDD